MLFQCMSAMPTPDCMLSISDSCELLLTLSRGYAAISERMESMCEWSTSVPVAVRLSSYSPNTTAARVALCMHRSAMKANANLFLAQFLIYLKMKELAKCVH